MAKLTIGMPVFNDIDFIEFSLKSILNQDMTDFILIISDDGSDDGSEALCKKYEQMDSRVQYIRQPINLGISKNMEFLLAQSKTEFFMWAADDDLWDKSFTRNLISLLEENKNAICAFSKYDLIDEKGLTIEFERDFDYSYKNCYGQVKKLINSADDGFGYGVFRTNKIRDVRFPIWWYPNRKTAYNNIFPSLCFYLNKGQYLHFSEKSLFFKRVKTNKYINHIVAGDGNAIKETLSFLIRRLNLVIFSLFLMWKTPNKQNVFLLFPLLFYKWFILSSLDQIRLAGNSFINNRLLK